MIEFVEHEYEGLITPDLRTFRRFVYFKQEVVLKTAELVGGVKKLVDASTELQRTGQTYLMAVYHLHQYILQLVIDGKKPNKSTRLELQRGLAVLHQTAVAFGRELDLHFSQKRQ